MKKLIYLFALILITQNTLAQGEANKKINWVSLEQAQELNSKEPRKIIIDLYTSWCGWCKRMDASTFSHPSIADYINEKYYAVKLNAETHDTIMFRGQAFVNPYPATAKRGTHQIASIGAREDGKIGYPTIVYLDEELNRISVLPGYQTAQGMEPIITYFGENHYKSTPWEEYQKEFKGTITE